MKKLSKAHKLIPATSADTIDITKVQYNMSTLKDAMTVGGYPVPEGATITLSPGTTASPYTWRVTLEVRPGHKVEVLTTKEKPAQAIKVAMPALKQELRLAVYQDGLGE